MSNRTFIFICGLALGSLLRLSLVPAAHEAAVHQAAPAAMDARCPAQALKMPCLFGGGQ